MNQLTRSKKNLRGFTIVELIVVISIIGILASIAIVSYTGTQNRANKSNYESYASQVKLKLGEYFTDRSAYPADKPAVMTYLNAVGGGALSTEFNKPDYVYACTNSCQGFTITVTKDKWKGASSDSNLVITN